MTPSPDIRDAYSGKPVLVTGGLGFIGSNLAIQLVHCGAKVTILDSLVAQHGGNWRNVSEVESRLRVNISDLRDLNSLRVLVQNQEFIFHLAGQVSHGDSMRDPDLDQAVNCTATINLLESCRHHNPGCRLIYTSTRQVYGTPRMLPVNEDHPALPIDVNGINKLAAEYYHLLYDRSYGLRSAVLRLTNTYGPRQQILNDRQGFVGIFIRKALKGDTIQLFGTGHQLRDFNYVADVVDALLRVGASAECFSRVMNLGAPKPYSLLEMVRILQRLCDCRYEIVPFPPDRRIIDIGDYYGDYTLLNTLTGWQPQVDLETGLARTIEFYRLNKEYYLP